MNDNNYENGYLGNDNSKQNSQETPYNNTNTNEYGDMQNNQYNNGYDAYTSQSQTTNNGYNGYTNQMNQPENNGFAANGETSQENSYPPYGYSDMFHDDNEKEKAKKSKGSGRKKAIIALSIVGIMVFSFCFGVAGSAFSNYFFKESSSSGSSTNKVTQSSGGTNTSASTSNGSSMSIADVTKNVADSVVEITTESVQTGNFMQQYVSKGAGSGVIMTSDGYIVTNNHVISDATKLTVKTRSGKEYTAKLIGKDSKTDLAVIKIDATGLTTAQAGTSADLIVGQTAIAIGNPLGSLGGTVTSGIISALDREISIDGQTMTLLQTSAAINPGNSGGGLFDDKGKLIGIVNAKSSGENVEGLGFAIPIDIAVPVINSIMENGYVTGRPALGVTLVDINDSTTAMQYNVTTKGVYIYSLTSGSAAYTAGLKPGDRIVSINKTEVSTSAEISTIITKSKVGDKLTIVYERDSKQSTTTATLQESKS